MESFYVFANDTYLEASLDVIIISVFSIVNYFVDYLLD